MSMKCDYDYESNWKRTYVILKSKYLGMGEIYNFEMQRFFKDVNFIIELLIIVCFFLSLLFFYVTCLCYEIACIFPIQIF